MLRSLRRTPGFTIAALLSLVLGIGSVGAMFAVVYGVLLAPLPYGEPERLVSVGLDTPAAGEIRQPPAVWFTYRQHAKSLSDVGISRTGSANVWTEGDGKPADSVIATWVNASMVSLLQVPPLLGRTFTREEEMRGGPDAVILSEAEWRSRFHAASDILGRTLMVNSVPRQVVGVMPARFAFPAARTRLWLPVKHVDNATVGDFAYHAVARLAADATVDQAQNELAAILPRMAEAFPRLESGGSTATWLADMRPTPVVLPLREHVTQDIAPTLLTLGAAAVLVLLVAWASLANLVLIRADERRPELAVRQVLGAGRLRIATHFLGEALLLGGAAALLALLVAWGAVRVLAAVGPAEVPRLAELGIGLPAAGFILAVTLASVMLHAAVPLLGFRRADTSNQKHRSHGASRENNRLRSTITVAQIALALVVLVGSALLLRTAQHLSAVHPGFDASGVTILRTQLPFARYDEAAAVSFYARLSEQVRELPSVRQVGLTSRVPLAPGESIEQIFRRDSGRTLALPVRVVDSGYFAAMRIPVLAGRSFRSLAEERGADIVISSRTAAVIFGDASGTGAVGKRMLLAGSELAYTVIGVVGDVRDQDLTTAPSPVIYRPQVVANDPSLEPAAKRNLALVVRSGDPDAVVAAIREIVRTLDSTVPIYNVETMSEVVRASTARLALALALMTIAAATTLVLGMIGLYGVMAYMVALRTREFGVRIALGASPARINRWVAMHGLVLTAVGVAAGFVLYALAAPFLRAFLHGVTTTDPATLIGATLVLGATAALAGWLPARRAASIDPAVALRAE